MKHKFKILSIIPIFIASLVLTGCDFGQFLKNRITQITISDAHEHYAVGDVFANEQELSITAKYLNGKTEILTYGNVTVSLASSKEMLQPTSPFASTGYYSVSVKYEDVTSNTLRFEVIESHIYVSSLSLSGESEIDNWTDTKLTLTASPSNYTVGISYAANDNSMVKLTKVDGGVKVTAQKAGEVDIIATSYKAKGVSITATHHITIKSTSPLMKVDQTYNDFIKNNYYNISGCPISGSPKLLVIPVWLTDSSNYISNAHKEDVREDIRTAYFGTTTQTGWHSVSSFYQVESQGKLNITGTVSEWYSCGYSTAQVGNETEAFSTGDLVKTATDWYFTNNPSDSRSNYDSDNDNVLDAVILIYAAPDKQQSGYDSYSNLWAYCFWRQKSESGIYPNVFFWASYDFMYGAIKANTRTGHSYANGDTSFCNVDAHTYIHEMGHVMGLDDYYDYSELKICPAGGFSMQDYNIGGHDPFSVMAFGWADAYVPTGTMTMKISDFQNNHDLILLSPEFNEYNSPFDEYLLLELYAPTGLNEFDSKHSYNHLTTGPTRPGIRLWHVDARLVTGSAGAFTISTSANAKQVKKVAMANSNTFYTENVSSEYLAKAGSNYYDFCLLQLIRNNTKATFKETDVIKTSDLFFAGDTFSLASFNRQFKNKTTLNNGKTLGWSFTVEAIEMVGGDYQATIQVTRA